MGKVIKGNFKKRPRYEPLNPDEWTVWLLYECKKCKFRKYDKEQPICCGKFMKPVPFKGSLFVDLGTGDKTVKFRLR